MIERNGEVSGVERDILNIDEAAELLGVSIKTFNKVLHAQDMPARKIGREWKFSRQALIDWVGSGRSHEFYRESNNNGGSDEDTLAVDGASRHVGGAGKTNSNDGGANRVDDKPRNRRTAGWQIEMD